MLDRVLVAMIPKCKIMQKRNLFVKEKKKWHICSSTVGGFFPPGFSDMCHSPPYLGGVSKSCQLDCVGFCFITKFTDTMTLFLENA